jgi:hypothetical protein
MADTWKHKTVISPDDVLYIDGELVIKGNVTQIETTQIINKLESNTLIINSDGSQGDNGEYAIPQLVLKYNYSGQEALGWGVMSYRANDVTTGNDAGMGYMRFSTMGYPVNGAIQLSKLQTMPNNSQDSEANIGILEGNLWSGVSAATDSMTSAVGISLTSTNNGGYTDIVPVAGAFINAGDIVTLNVNLDTTGVFPGIYGANTATTTQFTVDDKGRLLTVANNPIAITFDQVTGGTISGNTANSVYSIFSAGTGLTYTGTNAPQGQFYITDTTVGAGNYGQADSLVNFTVNQQGQLTQASNVFINIVASQVSDFEPAVEALLGAVTLDDGTAWTQANLAYTPGVFTYTTPTRAEVRNTISSTGDINYDNVNGVISLDNTITQDLTFTGIVDLSGATVPGFTITGNVDVLGNLNVVAKEDLYVQDSNIVMNVGNAIQDSHVVVDRSAGLNLSNSFLRWDSTENQWSHNDGTNEWVLVRDTDDIAEGTSNIWFTQDRVNTTIDAYMVAGEGIEFQAAIGPGNPNAFGVFADLGGNLEFDAGGQITTDATVVTNYANYTMTGSYDYTGGILVVPAGQQSIDGYIYSEISSNEAFIHLNGLNIPITPAIDFGRVDNGEGVIATGAIEVYGGTSVNAIGNANASIAIIRGLKAGANTSIYYDTDPAAEGNVIVIDSDGLNEAEVRSSLSATNVSGFGNISYDNNTGVFSHQGVSTSDIRNQFSATGLLSYSSATGEFTTSADNYNAWSLTTDDGITQTEQVTSNQNVTILGGTGISVTNAGNVITVVNTNTSADITSVIAGAGLTGGGTSGQVTLDTGAGPGIIVNPNNVAVDVAFIESIAPQGTLDSVTDNGNTTSNNITVNGLQTTSITTGAVATSGTLEGQWDLTAGSTLTSTYADLAEKYESDKKYQPGTVVVIGGDAEVTACHSFMSRRVAGVVSDNPAFVMNEELTGGVMVALKGRVPVKVSGQVKKGDLLVTADELGCATSAQTDDVPPTAVIGIALKDSELGYTEVKV